MEMKDKNLSKIKTEFLCGFSFHLQNHIYRKDLNNKQITWVNELVKLGFLYRGNIFEKNIMHRIYFPSLKGQETIDLTLFRKGFTK